MSSSEIKEQKTTPLLATVQKEWTCGGLLILKNTMGRAKIVGKQKKYYKVGCESVDASGEGGEGGGQGWGGGGGGNVPKQRAITSEL